MCVLNEKRCKLMKIDISSTNATTAPYRIEKDAFGINMPLNPLCLSASHKLMLRENLWMSSDCAAIINKNVKQYDLGKPVTYYHIICNDYLRDNVIAEGVVAETLATTSNYTGPNKIYHWNKNLLGFTRNDPKQTSSSSSCRR